MGLRQLISLTASPSSPPIVRYFIQINNLTLLQPECLLEMWIAVGDGPTSHICLFILFTPPFYNYFRTPESSEFGSPSGRKIENLALARSQTGQNSNGPDGLSHVMLGCYWGRYDIEPVLPVAVDISYMDKG